MLISVVSSQFSGSCGKFPLEIHGGFWSFFPFARVKGTLFHLTVRLSKFSKIAGYRFSEVKDGAKGLQILRRIASLTVKLEGQDSTAVLSYLNSATNHFIHSI
jgi:hypothetical protein